MKILTKLAWLVMVLSLTLVASVCCAHDSSFPHDHEHEHEQKKAMVKFGNNTTKPIVSFGHKGNYPHNKRKGNPEQTSDQGSTCSGALPLNNN